jgi:hypothetical protein
MISELLTYLLTSCPRYVRDMGYLYQAIALRGRYKRRQASWRSHLENTQKCLIRAAEQCSKRNRVVILGSGLLLDVPLEKLTGLFHEVVLVDVVHLPEVRSRIKSFRNVRLEQSDVTGVAQRLFENVKKGIVGLPASDPVIPDAEGTDLVVSLNIMSQLAAIPLDYVMKKMQGLDEAVIDGWCDLIRIAHYDALKNIMCDVCLVADYEFSRKDKEGNIVDKGSTVGGIVLPAPDDSWTWEIAPLGEEAKGLSKELMVGAWRMRITGPMGWGLQGRPAGSPTGRSTASPVRRELVNISIPPFMAPLLDKKG